MIQRFFLDRINAKTAGAAVANQLDLAVQALAHITQAALAFLQAAMARAEVALQLSIVKLVPVAC